MKLPSPKSGRIARPTIRSRCCRPPTVTGTDWPTRSPVRRSTEVPSTISCSEPGARPASNVGAISWPRPVSSPIAGTTAPPTPTVPCTPKVQPEMPGTRAAMASNRCGVMLPN